MYLLYVLELFVSCRFALIVLVAVLDLLLVSGLVWAFLIFSSGLWLLVLSALNLGCALVVV